MWLCVHDASIWGKNKAGSDGCIIQECFLLSSVS